MDISSMAVVRETELLFILHLLSFMHEHREIDIWVIMISSNNKFDKF